MTIVCRICGLPEDEHCIFEPMTMPDGCVCDPGSWDTETVTPICKKYKRPADDAYENAYCLNCEHDKRCHAK